MNASVLSKGVSPSAKSAWGSPVTNLTSPRLCFLLVEIHRHFGIFASYPVRVTVCRAPEILTPMIDQIYRPVVSKVVGFSHRRFGKLVGKYGYSLITRRLGNDEVLFLNWGYEEDPPMGLPLSASDEVDRFCIQLYHRVASQVDLKGKRVLEVSCGHGGAASYITRTFGPASYTGLDLNPAGIAFCQRRHDLPELSFVQGDAENLPFPEHSFDAVINVEAAHLYPHYRHFLEEVTRVLAPGGHFLYADLRGRPDVAEWDAALADSALREVSAGDDQRAGSARTREELAPLPGSGQPARAVVSSPVRSRCRGHEGLAPVRTGRERRYRVPAVLPRQGLISRRSHR